MTPNPLLTRSEATFSRDGAMSFYNQGNRPIFPSTINALKLARRPYNDDNHTIWVGGAVQGVSEFGEIDYEQARGFVCGPRLSFSWTCANIRR